MCRCRYQPTAALHAVDNMGLNSWEHEEDNDDVNFIVIILQSPLSLSLDSLLLHSPLVLHLCYTLSLHLSPGISLPLPLSLSLSLPWVRLV